MATIEVETTRCHCFLSLAAVVALSVKLSSSLVRQSEASSTCAVALAPKRRLFASPTPSRPRSWSRSCGMPRPCDAVLQRYLASDYSCCHLGASVAALIALRDVFPHRDYC